MRRNKYFFVFLSICAVIFFGAAAMPVKQSDTPKNLKILPKDISDEAIDTLMHEYNDALGVKCEYCHASSKDDIKKLDYASDEKPAKDIARDMMVMTAEINKQFFNTKSKKGEEMVSISCITCHNESEYPPSKL